MEDSAIKEMLEYRESLYQQLTVINALFGDETYTRKSNSTYYEDTYGVKKGMYYCKPQTAIAGLEACVKEMGERLGL